MSETKRPPQPDVGPHGPGRPRTVCGPSEVGVLVSAYLPAPDRARLMYLAKESGQSLSATVRQVLLFHIEK